MKPVARTVALVSSGTGGHLVPALVLARALRAAGADALLLTEGRAVESSLLARTGATARAFPVGRGMALPWRLAGAALRARRTLGEEHVSAVVCTGGRTSVPVALAARSLGLPLYLLEQNAVPGRANRWLAPFAERVYLGLPPVRPLRHGLLTGTPLRDEIGRIPRAEARARLGLAPDRATLLVTGGSQGAQCLNETVPVALVSLRLPLQVLHLSGEGFDEPVRTAYRAGEPFGLQAVVRPLAADMAELYAAADLVICRGGGGTVAELMAAGRAAVVVPYPHHRDRQQFHNAMVLVRAGAAELIEQPELTPQRLAETVHGLLAAERAQRMGEIAARLAPPAPTARIVADICGSRGPL